MGLALPLPKFVGQIYKMSYRSSLGSLFLFMTCVDIYVFEDMMNTFLWHLQFSGMLQPVTFVGKCQDLEEPVASAFRLRT